MSRLIYRRSLATFAYIGEETVVTDTRLVMNSLPIELVQFVAYGTKVLEPNDVLELACASKYLHHKLLSDAWGVNHCKTLRPVAVNVEEDDWDAVRYALNDGDLTLQEAYKLAYPLAEPPTDNQTKFLIFLVSRADVTLLDTPAGQSKVLAHKACKYGRLDIVKALLRAGACLTLESIQGHKPIHMAARYGHIEITRFLVEQGLGTPWDAYRGACSKIRKIDGEWAEFLIFLVKRLETEQLNYTITAHATLLHFACQDNAVGLVEALVDGGADTNWQSTSLTTPLHVACRYEHLDLVRYLIAHGADQNSRLPKRGPAWNARPCFNGNTETALSIALSENQYELAELLIEYGATAPQKALFRAIDWGCVRSVRLLVKSGIFIPYKIPPCRSSSSVARSSYSKIVKILRAARVDQARRK